MEKIQRPEWINANGYVQTLNNTTVQEPILNELSKKHEACYGIQKGPTAKDDAKYFLPYLMEDLRYYDISDPIYWNISFIGSILFFAFEGLIFLYFESSDLNAKSIIASCFFIALILLLYFASLNIIKATRKIPFFLKTVKIEIIEQIIPVTLVSLTLLSINFYLVKNSGWFNSPFMPALIFVSIGIIGAPRENSWTILILTLLAVAAVFIPFYFSFNIINTVTTPIQNNILANGVNIVTFFFTTCMTILLRQRSSKKLKQENN